jgi:hypothetical protein
MAQKVGRGYRRAEAGLPQRTGMWIDKFFSLKVFFLFCFSQPARIFYWGPAHKSFPP